MVLKNKLNISNLNKLNIEEERISKKKALELFDLGILDKLNAGTVLSLKMIHKYLF